MRKARIQKIYYLNCRHSRHRRYRRRRPYEDRNHVPTLLSSPPSASTLLQYYHHHPPTQNTGDAMAAVLCVSKRFSYMPCALSNTTPSVLAQARRLAGRRCRCAILHCSTLRSQNFRSAALGSATAAAERLRRCAATPLTQKANPAAWLCSTLALAPRATPPTEVHPHPAPLADAPVALSNREGVKRSPHAGSARAGEPPTGG